MSKFDDFNSPELHLIKDVFTQLNHLQLDVNIAYIVEQYIYASQQKSFYLKKDTLITEQFTTRFDKKDGMYKSWYSNNPNLKYEHSFYTNGLLEGESKKWALGGNIIEERIYSKGKLNGLATDWWFHGSILSSKWKECNYIDDKREGLYKEWFSSGQKRIETYYTNDKLEGPLTEYSLHGYKIVECNYSKGKKEGLYKRWHDGGEQLLTECNYSENNLHGEYKEYSNDGILIQHLIYENGIVI